MEKLYSFSAVELVAKLKNKEMDEAFFKALTKLKRLQ